MFWNADLKRWFKTLFIGVLFMLNFLRARESMLRNTRWWSRAWFQGREPERRIWRHINAFKCEFAFMLPQKPWFGRNADRKRTFLCVLKRRFETTFWNGVYIKMSMNATTFWTKRVTKRWFWPQKVKHKRSLRLFSHEHKVHHLNAELQCWIVIR